MKLSAQIEDSNILLLIGPTLYWKISRKGMFSPEEVISTDEFFDMYAKFCKKNLKQEDVLIKKEILLWFLFK